MNEYNNALELLAQNDLDTPSNKETIQTALEYVVDKRLPTGKLRQSRIDVERTLVNLCNHPGAMYTQPTLDAVSRLCSDYKVVRDMDAIISGSEDISNRFEEIISTGEELANSLQQKFNLKQAAFSALHKASKDRNIYLEPLQVVELVQEIRAIYAFTTEGKDLYHRATGVLSDLNERYPVLFADDRCVARINDVFVFDQERLGAVKALILASKQNGTK
jgi:hypothetical protein